MKQKNMYTLEELYTNLDISLSKLSKIASVTEATLTRIRDGYSARRETINKLLKAFSEVYGIDFSSDNVTGIILEDKKAIRRQMLARQGITEKAVEPSISAPAKTKAIIEKAPKRNYKSKEADLPEGCLLALDFGRAHGLVRGTFRGHYETGLGPKDAKEKIPVSSRPKPGREHEIEYYLTSEQQHQTLEFWQRHDVDFKPCNRCDCWCHTVFKQTEEKPMGEERLWYAPEPQEKPRASEHPWWSPDGQEPFN